MRPGPAVAAAFGISIVASLGLLPVYLLGGQAQVEGILLGLAFGGLGAGIVIWALFLMEVPVEAEDRKPLASPPGTDEALSEAAQLQTVTRRTFLVRVLLAAGGILAAALAIPTLSLGPAPGETLFRTPWSRGTRVVNPDGDPIRPDDIDVDSVTTVFPDGHLDSGDGVALLIRVRGEDLRLPDGRGDWAPDGCLVYSKVCTHAGCPVGLYRAEQHQLLCPCHQSTFDVLRGAVPTFGPAARPLPQLPLEVDEEGYLVARGDFPEPVGPSFWNLTHRREDAG